MQSMTYFRQTYGIERSITMFHRMRAWYRRHAEQARKDGLIVKTALFEARAAELTAYIKAARHVWAR